jgi:hypothetical protein
MTPVPSSKNIIKANTKAFSPYKHSSSLKTPVNNNGKYIPLKTEDNQAIRSNDFLISRR